MIAPLDVPDAPRWIEAHGIAGDPASWSRTLGDGRAVGNDAARLVVVLGDADPALVTQLARDLPRHTLLIEIERADLVAATARRGARVLLHTLGDPGGRSESAPLHVGPNDLPELEGAVALPAGASLAHVPPVLADELAAARGRRTIWSVFLDGLPVAFAYAPWRSARWFDVSVDTLVEARQLGLGRIVAAAMIRDERARGREPVWGADEANAGSLRLAHGLGFVPVDELWVAPCD